jgi:hypothetical protein
MLHDFHAVKGSEEIRATGNRTVIGEEKRVVVRNVRLEDGAEIDCAGSGVSHKRDFAEAHNDFGKKRLIESPAGSGESGGGGRMSVADGLDVGTHAIEEEVHSRFRGNLTIAVKLTALHVHDDEVFGSHRALVKASRSGKDAIGIEADGEIPFRGDNVAAFVHPAAN